MEEMVLLGLGVICVGLVWCENTCRFMARRSRLSSLNRLNMKDRLRSLQSHDGSNEQANEKLIRMPTDDGRNSHEQQGAAKTVRIAHRC